MQTSESKSFQWKESPQQRKKKKKKNVGKDVIGLLNTAVNSCLGPVQLDHYCRVSRPPTSHHPGDEGRPIYRPLQIRVPQEWLPGTCTKLELKVKVSAGRQKRVPRFDGGYGNGIGGAVPK